MEWRVQRAEGRGRPREELREFLLSVSEFAAAGEVDAKERHDRVDHQQLEGAALLVHLRGHEVFTSSHSHSHSLSQHIPRIQVSRCDRFH